MPKSGQRARRNGKGRARVALGSFCRTHDERKPLRFLELSGVERAMDDGVDEAEARTARLDGWIIWEAVDWVARRAPG
jgi:hypothetical protein